MFPRLPDVAAPAYANVMASEKSKPQPAGRVTVSTRLTGGGLVELVYSPKERKTRLAMFRGGLISIVESFDRSAEERLVPISATNNLIKHRAVLLPERPDSFGSVAELVSDIQAYLYRYIDLSDEYLRIASYYVLLTWVYDGFNELPYLRLRGDFGSGKTRALMVLGSICYKAFFASGASTVSPIFHTLDSLPCTESYACVPEVPPGDRKVQLQKRG